MSRLELDSNVTPRALLQTRSLRFWIMVGMLLAITPVAAAAVGGFVLLNTGVIGSFQDIADRQRTEIVPAQRIGLRLWDVATSVDEFVENGNALDQASFRAARTAIEADLASLVANVGEDDGSRALAVSAQQDWNSATDLGRELISVRRPAGDQTVAEQIERFDGAVRAASDKLESLIERLEADVGSDQQNADRTYERALWLAAIAAGVCLLTIAGGVVLIGRVMSASVDRLVDGALRFAEGDRSHRIDIRIPPELRRVADEFNRMISKIHAFEDMLSERALKDALTGLPNRRAFDEAMERNWYRLQQFGDDFAVLMLDVDHFKRVNDSYGHAAGDEVLRKVAETLAQQLRTAHPVFRTGGEEFAVIVPSARTADALVIAERLRAAVKLVAMPVAGDEVGVTISVGITDSRGCNSAEEMLQVADAALYRAKGSGRDRAIASGDRRASNASAA